jgi:hypothetical protein
VRGVNLIKAVPRQKPLGLKKKKKKRKEQEDKIGLFQGWVPVRQTGGHKERVNEDEYRCTLYLYMKTEE